MVRQAMILLAVVGAGVLSGCSGCGALTPEEDISYGLCESQETGSASDPLSVSGMQVGHTIQAEVWRERNLLLRQPCYSGAPFADFTISSSAPQVVEVVASGAKVTLRALAPGDAEIVVRADGRQVYKHPIAVREPDTVELRALDLLNVADGEQETPRRALQDSVLTISYRLIDSSDDLVELRGQLAPEDWTISPEGAAEIITTREQAPGSGLHIMALQIKGAPGEAFTLTHRLGLVMPWTIAGDDTLGALVPTLPYLPMEGVPFVDRLTSTGGESTITSGLIVRLDDKEGALLYGQPTEGATIRLEGHDPDDLKLVRMPSRLEIEALDTFKLVGSAPGDGQLVFEARGLRRVIPIEIKPAI